jgi:hypothetical protein
MNRYQIERTLQTYKLYDVKIVVGDEIPIGKSIVFAWVFGTEMGHWVAVEKDGQNTLLIDSYGLKNNKRYHIPFLGDNYVWTNFHGQRYGTKYCALYAIAYFILRTKLTFGHALQALYPNTTGYKHNSTFLSNILGQSADQMLAGFANENGVARDGT